MLNANVNGKSIVLVLLMILFIIACGGDDVDIDYLRDFYTPTPHVDVYFSDNNALLEPITDNRKGCVSNPYREPFPYVAFTTPLM